MSNKRRVLIGAFSAGCIAGYSISANRGVFEELPPFSMNDLIYTQLLQSGAKEVHVTRASEFLPNRSELPPNRFLRERIVLSDNLDASMIDICSSIAVSEISNPGISRGDLDNTTHFLSAVL